MATNNFLKTIKILKEANSNESKTQALTNLRRTHLEDQKIIQGLKEDEFCELCNSVISATTVDDEQLYIEACRTLDTILLEAQNREFDFFKSVLQINRKKRLKILVSLSILKDETIATVANKQSILDFLNNCVQSIQPKSMVWLLPENADNATLLKSVESRNLNENEEIEEKIVEKALQLLCRLNKLVSIGLNIQLFDTFIMDKIIVLSYMGHCKQRSHALAILQEAVKNDFGIRIRSFHREVWEKYKAALQTVYCKRMTLLVNISHQDWAIQWETSIALIGTDLHRGSGLVNSLLKVEELAFKSADPNRRQAFLSWKLLIDNFALDQRELATTRRIKLLCVPLNAKNSKTELMVLTKMEVWWHLIYKIYPSIAEFSDTILIPFLNLCFGPFGDKPLFVQKTDAYVSLGKKFSKTQMFAIDAFIQLIVNKENFSKIPSFEIQEKLPNPVNNSIFQNLYKIFIHCFGEIVIILGTMPNEEDIKNRVNICRVLWDSLIKRIDDYDKMKISMYKEVVIVIHEIIKNRFHKIAIIRDFLLEIILNNFENSTSNMHFTENALIDLMQTFLQIDNFSNFTNDHFKSIESLLWHIIKAKNADVYYPQTMELMQTILQILDEAKEVNRNMTPVCKIWCILAKVAKKFAEDSQNMNEGTTLEHNFKTFESIIAFPFTGIFTDDYVQLKNMAESWIDLYKQFDFQAELIVTVQANEVLNKTSNMIIAALKKEKKCCDFAAICIDGILSTVNYDTLSIEKEEPFINFLKELILQCLRCKSFATEKALKALSSFLLRVFSHNIEKIVFYLKIFEPVVKYMLAKVDDNYLESDILSTWSTIVGLFKKLQNSLNCDLLDCYRQTIVLAMLHLHKDISSLAFSILDLKESVGEKSKKVLEDIVSELEKTSVKNSFDLVDIKENTKKSSAPFKPIGSFLNRKVINSSSITNSTMRNRKDNTEKHKLKNIEPDSQDYVVIDSDIKLDINRLTDHQKEMLKKRREDIPAMYNELTVSNSQDSQELQQWFDAKSGKSFAQKSEMSNKNEEIKASSPLHFKNLAQVLSNEKQKNVEKTMIPADIASKKEAEKQVVDADVSTIEDSQKKAESESAPNVAKKLDFESRDEFPADREQISPSIIDNSKMRRRSVVEESSAEGIEQDKNVRSTRRSLQPRQGILRKSNSIEQLNKRGKKRRNSESNSEGMLNIEREKRPRRENTPDMFSSNADSAKTSEEIKNENLKSETDNKKVSKRQMIEMSRLKIDMRFEPLPNRRSLFKVNETSNSTNKKATISKDEKLKEEKAATITKTETNQQLNSTVKRRSLKNNVVHTTKNDTNQKEATNNKKDNGLKKAIHENSETNNKSTARKSLSGTIESIFTSKKKNEVLSDTQEEILIEDVSTQTEVIEKNNISEAVKFPNNEKEDTETADLKCSQDSDIVESSQEPTSNLKMDKVECFIKIKKVEIVQAPSKVLDETSDKDEQIENTVIDVEETLITDTTTVTEPEKNVSAQEIKKIENNFNKPLTNHISSPKSAHSRIFRSKGFPLQGRAAQMLGLVTKQSIAEKLANSDILKSDTFLSDEITIVPLPKKDKIKENERSSPSASSGSRQEKMFNNMNNSMKQDRCSSPASTAFCNLKNDGERISPKLDKRESDLLAEKDISQSEISIGDDSPNAKARKELPILEWSSANPPSLTASPSASILKRMQEIDIETPNRKKRVSFADPPVSREMSYEIMTESSASPKLEKLSSIRSPISRKEFKKHAKLRLIQIDQEKLEKENETAYLNNAEEKINESEINEMDNVSTDTISISPDVMISPKIKLVTFISETATDGTKIEVNNTESNTQDVDMFVDNNNSLKNEDDVYVKTSTQNEPINSSVKFESINLSNIANKLESQQTSLEDTVDVENISSSLDSISNSEKPTSSCSQQSGEASDTLPVTDSVFSNLPSSQESQSSVAQLNEPENLNSTLPVYPTLTSCMDAVESISADLVDPLFTNQLAKHLSIKSIRSVGDLALLTERDINRLPIKNPKIFCVKKALSRYEEKLAAKTPEHRSINAVSSSTPLGNKPRDKTKAESDSFEDLMKNNSSHSDLGLINVSALYENKKSVKRQSTDSSVQTSPFKKAKKSDEEVCSELMDQCEENVLFEAFINKFDAEKILKAYKEKMNNKSEKELKKETLNMLGLSEEDDSEESLKAFSKTNGLAKVLQQLPNIFNDDEKFFDEVLNVYKKKLKASDVLEALSLNEMKTAIVDKFSSSELLNILTKKIELEKASGANKVISDTNDVQFLLNSLPSNSIMDQVKIRNELKSSESLLKIILENCVEKLSVDSKRTILKTITEKLDVCELADMYNEAIKLGVHKMQQM